MSVNKGAVVTSATTATSFGKRTVSDQIRRFNTKLTPVMSLVKTQDMTKDGQGSYGKGIIEKQGCKTRKFEWFTASPISIYFTATGGSAISVEVADTSTFATRDVVVNLTTLEVGIVITMTSTTAIAITAVGGTWSCAAGDVIALTMNAQEEGGSTYVSRTQEPSNNFNYLQEFRFAVEIANTARNSPDYAEDKVSRYKQDNMYLALRTMDNGLMLGKKATSEVTAVTIGSAMNMYTTRGLMDFSQVTIDCGGTLTYDRWNTEFSTQLPNTLDPDDELVMISGSAIAAKQQNWVDQKFMLTEQEVDVFGTKASKFRCGPYLIKTLTSDLFNHGPLANQAVVFRTKDLKYRFMDGMDLQVNENIQSPSAHSRADELTGVIGLEVTSGGQEVIRVINWN
jgi:hypothetical protein